jgi:hypothetical protein
VHKFPTKLLRYPLLLLFRQDGPNKLELQMYSTACNAGVPLGRPVALRPCARLQLAWHQQS